jgi:hypothetical protein
MKYKLHSKYSELNRISNNLRCLVLLLFALTALPFAYSQDLVTTEKDKKPVRSMFESTWLIDNQTAIVPSKGTLQMDILHRFGTTKNGIDDFYGFFAPSNIKLGFSYTVINNLAVGFGITKTNMTWDLHAKYALLQQTRSGSTPLSVTYFGNAAIDSRDKDNFVNGSDRMSYFHQIIIARKFSDKLSLQVAPSLSHYNAVEAFLNQMQEVEAYMNNDHLAVAIGGRLKVSGQMSIIANYDQPITDHASRNPEPNLSFGIEISTSSHAFQIFAGNYKNIIPQRNNVFNSNDLNNGEFLIGFNITRLWSL